MITATPIRNGEGYLVKHLAANDYYSEGESVTGFWIGKGASMLSLNGEVLTSQYESLRLNRHPSTGEKLTPRSPKVAFHDMVISAPKAFSIVAMVGRDERLIEAFHESVRFTFGRLEEYAAVRLRTGSHVKTEAIQTTGIACAAVYVHDTSRLLDPQVHAHVLLGNFSQSEGRWLALQPRAMLEASKSHIRQEFRRDLAKRVTTLGYEAHCAGDEFRIEGISSTLERRFSRRALQREAFENRYLKLFGNPPPKARIEAFIKEGKSAATKRFKTEYFRSFGLRPSETEVGEFVRDYRSDKMSTSSREAVLKGQLDMLSKVEAQGLARLVAGARKASVRVDRVDGRLPLEITQDQNIFEEEIGQSPESSSETERVAKKAERWDRVKLTISNPPPSTGKLKKMAGHQKTQRIKRLDALRRMRAGMDLAKSINGNPSSAIARQIRRQCRRA